MIDPHLEKECKAELSFIKWFLLLTQTILEPSGYK